MRILCLEFLISPNPQELQPSTSGNLPATGDAEIFLRFSPRVQMRDQRFLFIDIASTRKFFASEVTLAQTALNLAAELGFRARVAIANTCSSAQAFCGQTQESHFFITEESNELKQLHKLPIESISYLEGLFSWTHTQTSTREVSRIVDFFHALGFQCLQDLVSVPSEALMQRWQQLGSLLYKRIRNLDEQIISPLISQEPFSAFLRFDEPISNVHWLSQGLELELHKLFLRLQAHGRFAQKISLNLYCEYSQRKHFLEIEPVTPNRDEKLFFDLIVSRLENIELDNPIREIEMTAWDVPEKLQQLDFFEPRDSSTEKWQRLISFAKAQDCEMGFLQIRPEHLPEKSFQLITKFPVDVKSRDFIEFAEAGALQLKKSYAKNILKTPRPTLLLKEPQKLTKKFLKDLRRITRFPSERIEGPWWKSAESRDYYFALTQNGELIWIFQNTKSKDYFLHGYFD